MEHGDYVQELIRAIEGLIEKYVITVEAFQLFQFQLNNCVPIFSQIYLIFIYNLLIIN